MMPQGSSPSLNVLRPGEGGEAQVIADREDMGRHDAGAGPRLDEDASPALPPLSEDRVSANRRELERDLREALDAGQLHLHWQPIVNCLTGVLQRFEALVRWNRPGCGKVSSCL